MTENVKLIVQKLVSADKGEERVTMFECRDTGDLIVRFGGSYTLRAKAGEMSALLLELSVNAAAAAGGVIDVD
jgi:hypothetical protein